MEQNNYFAFGLRIVSDLPLPELVTVAPFPQCDVSIRVEPLPASAPGRRLGKDEACLTVRNVARYRIRQGRDISVDPNPCASERSVRLFLLGSVLGILCHQRGLLPLHANAIVINGVAMAFAGRAGIGKSTLAAYFQSRGYEVLSDDVCVIDFDEAGRPRAWPGLPRLKLWRDAAETFGYDSQNLSRTAEGIDKYHVPLRAPQAPGAVPLARLYVLSDLPCGVPGGVSRLKGVEALHAIVANTYRGGYLKEMGLLRVNLSHAELLSQHATILTAPRERGYGVFFREAGRLEEHLLGGGEAVNGPVPEYSNVATGDRFA